MTGYSGVQHNLGIPLFTFCCRHARSVLLEASFNSYIFRLALVAPAGFLRSANSNSPVATRPHPITSSAECHSWKLSYRPAPSSATSELPRQYDLIRVVTLSFTLGATVPLTYLMGCSIASNDKYKVGYLQHCRHWRWVYEF